MARRARSTARSGAGAARSGRVRDWSAVVALTGERTPDPVLGGRPVEGGGERKREYRGRCCNFQDDVTSVAGNSVTGTRPVWSAARMPQWSRGWRGASLGCCGNHDAERGQDAVTRASMLRCRGARD
jgi:hypothetical protein